MIKIVGIRFNSSGKIYYFNPGQLDIMKNDMVIVETVRGIEIGKVIIGITHVEETSIIQPLKSVISIADETDKNTHKKNIEKAQDAMDICNIKIHEHGLDMKLIDCEYTFDNNKVIFYFTAEDRVDFRELVKDLAVIFKTRIELRQIGVRDEAKILGGIGSCGQCICCKRFLDDFVPVSIKMAKTQNLSLNTTKISGLCGRLMCCLKYENDVYEEKIRNMPKEGMTVETPMGKGIVTELYVIHDVVKVKFTDFDGVETIKNFNIKDLKYRKEGVHTKDITKIKEDVS